MSIDEIAREAGISKGLLYHYFPTKRDFYVATIEEAARRLVALTAGEGADTPDGRLRVGVDAYLDYVERHAEAYVALLRSGVGFDHAVAEIVDRTRTAMCERILDALPPEARAPLVRAALRGWLGFVEAMSLDWLVRPSISRDALRDFVVLVLFDALRNAGAPLS